MDYNEFVDAVAKRLGVPADKARTMACATLKTLAERIDGGEARDLASELPEELRDYLFTPRETAEPFDLAEFVRRVSTRAAVDIALASDGARAVFDTVREAVAPSEFDDFLSQLPKQFWDMTGPVRAPVEVPRSRATR